MCEQGASRVWAGCEQGVSGDGQEGQRTLRPEQRGVTKAHSALASPWGDNYVRASR